jgi:hypothetical protein
MRALWSRGAVQTRNDRGVALFAAIAGMVLLSTMIAALVILARNENLIAQLNKDEAQAAYAAEAGANWGRRVLHRILHTNLPARVVVVARPTMATALQTTYNTSVGSAQFIRDYAVPTSGPTFVACSPCVDPAYSVVYSDAVTKQINDNLQNVLTLTCPGTTGCPANMAFTTRVIVSAHPTIPPAVMTGANVGATFTYVWRIESSGTAGRARQQYVIHDSSVPVASNLAGSFTIALNGEFVKYAHFIDQFQDAGSGEPWISWRHVYTGPVHTNRRFSILGGSDNVGPTFRSEATQTMTTTRFSNGGSETNLSRDSSSQDWPKLGAYPGILCQLQDCSGFTRGFDFNTTTGTIDPIPFPGGANPNDRLDQICMALGIAFAVCPRDPAAAPVPTGACVGLRVVVANNCAPAPGALTGGIYVSVAVHDLRLAHVDVDGQSIVIYTDNSNRRAVIKEKRALNQTWVRRECLKTTNTDLAACVNGGGFWRLDPGELPNTQTFDGNFSPNPATDYGMIFVVNASIGQAGTSNGLRRGDENGTATPTAAIYQNPASPAQGTRLTVAADRNIWITGPLNYRVDPRGTDGLFSDPIPGTGDDEIDVQNVLGVLSWALPPNAGGVRLSSALTGDLQTHGMVFAANLSLQGEPSGQFSFDDPNGTYRGISYVLGGVVQKTMGTFGQPGSNLGYARDWIYDERFRYRALSPPAFPGFPNFTAATSLGIDSYTWRLGLF